MLITPSPAQSDPITTAAQEIAELESKINNLVYKDQVRLLIDAAISDFLEAKDAQENLSLSIDQYENAVEQEGIAENAISVSQSAIDGQTAVVEVAFNTKNEAQTALEAANINVETARIPVENAGNQGWQFTAYYLTRGFGGYAMPDAAYCSGVLTQAYQGMPICGRYENMYVVYSGKITAPNGVNEIMFRGFTDDGFRMYVNGQLVIQQWVDQGSTWSSPYTHTFTSQNRTIDVVFHYFNGGGPGVFHVGWGHSGIWTGVSPSAMSYGVGATQEQINAYNEALEARDAAQENYNNASQSYSEELQKLNEFTNDLNNAIQVHEEKQDLLSQAFVNKETAGSVYSQKLIEMHESIDNAKKEYNKQFDFEEKQRIAAAIAGAIKPMPEPTTLPTPETTPEPTPEPGPSPEPTEEPTPEPTEEPTSEPTEEPTPEPTPEPTTEPTVEPTPEPAPSEEPTPLPSETPIEQPEEVKPIVIPEKITVNNISSVLANLTSKDNLTQLTPEQKEVISGTLGIQATELSTVIELASKDEAVAQALEEFSERAKESADAPMPYTLADAITETQAEEFLNNPLSAITDINVGELLSNFSELGSDMTDDQREKAQEVIIPVVIVSQIASAMIAMRR